MIEGRNSIIYLPWSRISYKLYISNKSTSNDIIKIISEKYNIKDKQFFSLSFKDDKNNNYWLINEKRVLEHDFIRHSSSSSSSPSSSSSSSSPSSFSSSSSTSIPLILYFTVKFYAESFENFNCPMSIELFYLRAKHLVFKENIKYEEENLFKLAALALQESYQHSKDEECLKQLIAKEELIPPFILHQHPSLQYCENKIMNYYKSLSGNSRGMAITGFLSICQTLPSYGLHYYEVKDKNGMNWWLALGRKGLFLFDFQDKLVPRKSFQWKDIGNIFYRDKKFSFEVQPPKQDDNESFSDSSFSNNKQLVNQLTSKHLPQKPNSHPPSSSFPSSSSSFPSSFSSSSNVTIETQNCYCLNTNLTSNIWYLAVSQHQFSIEFEKKKNQNLITNFPNDFLIKLIDNSSSILLSSNTSSSSSFSSSLIPSKLKQENLNKELFSETNKLLLSFGGSNNKMTVKETEDIIEKAKKTIRKIKKN